jgi:hypothetical protein
LAWWARIGDSFRQCPAQSALGFSAEVRRGWSGQAPGGAVPEAEPAGAG